jgi:hypothetical protein
VTIQTNDETVLVIPFGNNWIVLSPQQFRDALQRGQGLAEYAQNLQQAPAGAEDRVLDAEGMEAATGIPATWFLEQARQRRIPHIRAGKYVRFRLSEVLSALHIEVHTDRQPSRRKQYRGTNGYGPMLPPCYHKTSRQYD